VSNPQPDARALARRQQRIEELCAASIRALAGEPDLHFRGTRLHRGRTRLPRFAPHLHPSVADDDFGSFRGAADGLAARLRLSDATRFAHDLPADPAARLLFGLFEQFRVEALAAERWPGTRGNLRHRFDAWSAAFHHSGLADTARGLLLYTVIQVARARITADPVLEETEDLMEATRAALAPAIGHALAGMRRARHDQAAFAVPARALADLIAQMLANAGAETDGDDDDASTAVDAGRLAALLGDVDEPEDDGTMATVVTGRSRVLEAAADGYRVFTTAYDRELRPHTEIRAAMLDDYRRQLDARIAAQGVNVPRLARALKALLSSPARDDWADAQEEGLVDGRRLAQLVASPTERRLFRLEQRPPRPDCVVGVLIDCSGSMRAHIESVAMLADVLARALDLAGVASEILGFTTGGWNGGRAARDWQRAGRPAHPGRLNERLHLVLKDADTRWARARRGIAALLRAEMFREGLDGEALAWAAARLQAREATRRLLIVVSDGCPMDTATSLANDPHYLDHHLQQVAGQLEAAGSVELYAIGVGLDLSPYYGRCEAIDLDAGLGSKVFEAIVALIGTRGHR
jgi:cobaltochelatase CobT